MLFLQLGILVSVAILSVDANQLNLEVLFVLDYPLYQRWENIKKVTQGKATINQFYSQVVKGVQERLDTLNINPKIKLTLVDVFIADSKDKCPYIYESNTEINEQSISGWNAVDNLRKWIQNNKNKVPEHDVFVLYSGKKVMHPFGISEHRSMCSDKSGAIVQEVGLIGTADHTAHEIAKMLGADTEEQKTECTSHEQYLMSYYRAHPTPQVEGNYDRFSSCSSKTVLKFIQELDKNKTNCMKTDISKKKYNLVLDPLVGKNLPVDLQCQNYYGKESYYCAGGGSKQDKMCEELFCWNPLKKKCDLEFRQFADDGTQCDNKKWCINRKCVSNPSAPTAEKPKCIYGDFKGILQMPFGTTTCEEMKNATSWLCYSDNFRQYCCETCGKLRKEGDKSCEYGDKKDDGCRLGDCTHPNKYQCCRTCEPFMKGTCDGKKPDLDWCKDIQSFECYIYGKACCKKCEEVEKKANLKIPDCQYGNQEGWCSDYLKKNPKSCKNERVELTCCASCYSLKPKTQGPDCTADSIPSHCQNKANVLPKHCYHADTEKTCCKTCKDYSKGKPKGCKYGDKYSWCNKSKCTTKDSIADCCESCQGVKLKA